jgi:Winged helix DNA-binding domain
MPLSSASAVRAHRLHNQRLWSPFRGSAADLVRAFGAVQAQDPSGSLWALGLRLRGGSEEVVEKAIAGGAIVRTWPMRGTLHYVPAEDAAWMLRLLTPRVIALSAGRYRQLELGESAFTRAARILARALRDGRRLTRREAYAALERGGVSPAGQRGIHILGHLAQQGLICFGPRSGKQPTFVLLDEWVRRPRDLRGDEALATLAVRYFTSHGPATVQDFAWWSGLRVREAQAAIAAAGQELVGEVAGRQHFWRAASSTIPRSRPGPLAALLPPWDEYVVAYKDRTGLFGHLRRPPDRMQYAVGFWLLVVDGRVCGTWARVPGRSAVRVDARPWARLAPAERDAVAAAAARYAKFVGREVDLRIAASR